MKKLSQGILTLCKMEPKSSLPYVSEKLNVFLNAVSTYKILIETLCLCINSIQWHNYAFILKIIAYQGP